MKISSISAHQIFDSRGKPTIECELTLADGSTGRGLVPSGASTGQYEALELRDNDPQKFNGLSVHRAHRQHPHRDRAPCSSACRSPRSKISPRSIMP